MIVCFYICADIPSIPVHSSDVKISRVYTTTEIENTFKHSIWIGKMTQEKPGILKHMWGADF